MKGAHDYRRDPVSFLLNHRTMCGGCLSQQNMSGPTCSLYPNPVAQAYGTDFEVERVKLTKDIQKLLLAYCQGVDLNGTHFQDTSDTLWKSQSRKSNAILHSLGAEEKEFTTYSQSSWHPRSIHNSSKTQLCQCGRPKDESSDNQSSRFYSEEAASSLSDGSSPTEVTQNQQVVRPTDIFLDARRMEFTNPQHRINLQTILHDQQLRIQH